jgi:hypothetical protein
VDKADLRRWVDDRRAVARLEQKGIEDAWGLAAALETLGQPATI